ncbi:ribonuclease III [Algimonas porphyrae]|uniref:Ribonuclease 3 n=1 Tax=Algimonas porphyrae TaxID=1128113 RepID=A0ABQ5UYX5_9PROT|nr:ribonuclease III [Algimonas porphyrae]GLQ20052.1 ribonuclease 3 [Algimonas porphyrae]
MSELDRNRYRRVEKLEQRLDYRFKDRDLAMRALTHSSYGDGQTNPPNNERLEFLGDRVLGLMTAEILFNHSREAEGTLARRLNALVRKETCADVARRIDLGECVLISPSEERQGGRDKDSILGDACEALIAALYLDGGMAAAQTFYNTYWKETFDRVVSRSAKDPKTELQERAMAMNHSLPDYQIVDRTGPDHAPEFVVEVSVRDVGSAIGRGKSKRDAERLAAKALIEAWA